MGLPMWFLPEWRGKLMTLEQTSSSALSQYSQVFGSVEGNTTFYALPSKERVAQWLDQVNDDFRFCFKVPRDISHSRSMQVALQGQPGREFGAFLDALVGRDANKLGVVMLQLPASVEARAMGEILAIMDALASGQYSNGVPLQLALECRHLSFFDKSPNEATLLRELHSRQMDRVIFDTRGIMAEQGDDEELLDAQRKKPRMPVHAVASGPNPIVRFIGFRQFERNRTYLDQWFSKLHQWLQEGKTPYVFWHTAGNRDVPEFHRWIMQQWCQQKVEWPGENSAGVTGDLWG